MRDRDERRNIILFIMVDHLRPQPGCYGVPWMKTPNMGRIAAEGMTFTRNYCQVALSSPSRIALFSGLHPDSSRVWWIDFHFRSIRSDIVVLPGHFKAHGYHTQVFGKVYHDR